MARACSYITNTFLDQFQQIKELGKGGFGEVYLIAPKIQIYAVKKQLVFDKGSNMGVSRSSIVEMDSLLNLNPFPEVINPVGACVDPHIFTIVMEPMDINLKQFYQERGFGERNRLLYNLFETLIRAASIFERLNIVHFDIKPLNILVRLSNPVRFAVADLGSVRRSFHRYYVGGTRIFTPRYQSPEVLAGRNENEFSIFKNDVWSIASTIFEYISGVPLIWNNDIDGILNEIIYLSKYPGDVSKFINEVLNGTIHGAINVEKAFQEVMNKDLFDQINRDVIKVLTVMLSLNPADRPSATSILNVSFEETLDENKFRLIPEPRVERRIINVELVLIIRDLATFLFLEFATVVIALETLTRFLGILVAEGNLNPKYETVSYAVATLRLASLYNEKQPPETRSFVNTYNDLRGQGFNVIVDEEIFGAEQEILPVIGFHIYNNELTPLILDAYERNIDIRGIPPERFTRPLVEWFRQP